jgi:hypothetical protein
MYMRDMHTCKIGEPHKPCRTRQLLRHAKEAFRIHRQVCSGPEEYLRTRVRAELPYRNMSAGSRLRYAAAIASLCFGSQWSHLTGMGLVSVNLLPCIPKNEQPAMSVQPPREASSQTVKRDCQ